MVQDSMTTAYDLFLSWFRVADWCAYSLQKHGYQALILSPLGKFSRAASVLSELAIDSDDYVHRKTAAAMLGWIEEPRPQSLSEFFVKETARDRSLAPQSPERLSGQSVVEDLVFSAARWARSDDLRPQALEFLTTIVETTIDGDYWNTSSYAMTTLVLRHPDGVDDLLEKFSEFANGPEPDHPSRPTLQQERQFAEQLLLRNPDTLQAIENVLNAQDEALDLKLDPESERSIAELLATAERFDRNVIRPEPQKPPEARQRQ